MKFMASLQTITCLSVLALTTATAQASTKYILTITNGGGMPLSPAVIYVKKGQSGNTQIGQEPSPGFVKLCQTGMAMMRTQELKNESSTTFMAETNGLIQPGESRMVELEVLEPLEQSIQFETMYGKTKDTCAIGMFGSHSLYALKQHVTSDIYGKDQAVQTGVYLNPMTANDSMSTSICSAASDAVSCLRELSLPNKANAKVQFSSPYLPSVLNFLETKYGAAEVQSLLIPSSGAVQLHLKLKH